MVHVIVKEAEPEDRRPVWEWWNDPLTRKMMKTKGDTPWDVHCRWFEAVLQDPDRILCVGIIDDRKAGVVRFDRQGGFNTVFEVSINLNPSNRFKGNGQKILTASIEYLKDKEQVDKLWASMKRSNIASQRTFEKAGFSKAQYQGLSYPGLSTYAPEMEYYYELVF